MKAKICFAASAIHANQYSKHRLYSLITSESFAGFTKETQNNIRSSHITQRLHFINTVHRARKSLPNVGDSKALVSSSPANSEYSTLDTPNQNNQLQQYSLTCDDTASMVRINKTANRSCLNPHGSGIIGGSSSTTYLQKVFQSSNPGVLMLNQQSSTTEFHGSIKSIHTE